MEFWSSLKAQQEKLGVRLSSLLNLKPGSKVSNNEVQFKRLTLEERVDRISEKVLANLNTGIKNESRMSYKEARDKSAKSVTAALEKVGEYLRSSESKIGQNSMKLGSPVFDIWIPTVYASGEVELNRLAFSVFDGGFVRCLDGSSETVFHSGGYDALKIFLERMSGRYDNLAKYQEKIPADSESINYERDIKGVLESQLMEQRKKEACSRV